MDFNTSRKDYYKTKRLLLTESFDMNYPVDDDSDTDTDALSTIWLNSEMKTEHFDVPENSERDISIDDNISVIGKLQENFRQEIGHESNQELQTSYLKHEDSISQMISKSFLEGLPDHEDSLSEEEKYIQQEWEKQIQLHKKDQICHSESYQEDEKPKMELSYTPRYTKHDVYYLFQYHLIEHALDWLFLPEEPNLLIELLSDQQAIYATQTLSMITDKMPEGEIMPCYFAFKGMISLFVSDFTKAFNYFDKASLVEDNILFLFWKIVSKFYIWMETRDFEDFSILKLLVSKFERL